MQSSPQFECSNEKDETNYLSGLSTILVANIQEVKDRISHIEFIFCSQLFPNFQSRSKLLEKRLVQEKRALEHDWKTKESILLSQIEKLHIEKQHAQEQIQHLNLSLEQSNTRLTNTEQLLKECESEKKKLLDKLDTQEKNEEIIAGLREQLRQNNELAKETETQETLLQQIELKDNELLVEKSKRRSLIEEFKIQYKELKSENNYLRKKIGCTIEKKPHPEKTEAEEVLQLPLLKKRSFQDRETAIPSKPCEMDDTKSNFPVKFEPDLAAGPSRSSSVNSHINVPSSSSRPPTHVSGGSKPETSGSLKRATSSWRGTRVREQARDDDPHDDFLNTPMELARNLNMVQPDDPQDIQAPPPVDMDFNISDDETQDITAEADPQQQPISVLPPVNKGFKYVEPVRKKAERENLKGVECKQCKKFYDAVLPDGGQGNDRNTTDGFNNMRCEHHDGVSRHRYRYAPPMTPEGFWNIGFESEM